MVNDQNQTLLAQRWKSDLQLKISQEFHISAQKKIRYPVEKMIVAPGVGVQP